VCLRHAPTDLQYVVSSSLGVMCRYVVTFQRTKIQNTRTHNNIALIKLVHTLASRTTRHHPHNQYTTHHTLTSLLALTQAHMLIACHILFPQLSLGVNIIGSYRQPSTTTTAFVRPSNRQPLHTNNYASQRDHNKKDNYTTHSVLSRSYFAFT